MLPLMKEIKLLKNSDFIYDLHTKYNLKKKLFLMAGNNPPFLCVFCFLYNLYNLV